MFVDAAVHLIETRGAAVLSARTLGTAVGADPTALYRYFPGIDDVLRAVADRMIGIALDRWAPDADWVESLRTLARALHHVYTREFPLVGFATAARTTGLPNEIRAVEITIGLLRAGGFDEPNAARRFRAISDFMLGQAMLETAFAALPANVQVTDLAAWEGLPDRLPAANAPHTESVAGHLQTLMLEASFEDGLDLILRGLVDSPRN